MSRTSTYQPPFRRRGEGRTNYAKRLAFVKSNIPRIVIRKTTNHLSVQIIQTVNGNDHVITSARTAELKKFNYEGNTGNIPAAYLVGLLAGKRALGKVKGEIIVDIGVQRPVHKTRLFAAVKGIKDAGLSVKVDEESLPSDTKVMGKDIESFAQGDASKMNGVQFSTFKGKMDLATFTQAVEIAKKAINEGVSTS